MTTRHIYERENFLKSRLDVLLKPTLAFYLGKTRQEVS